MYLFYRLASLTREYECRKTTASRHYQSLRIFLQLDDRHSARRKGRDLLVGYIAELRPACIYECTLSYEFYSSSSGESTRMRDGMREEMLAGICRPAMVSDETVARLRAL